MPSIHCPICLSHLTIDKFVVFPCGHGFCVNCKNRMFQNSTRPKCPNCRIQIRDREGHPLFLELVSSKTTFVSSIVDGLDKMDHETPLLSVKKAGQKLAKVLQDPDSAELDVMTALINAIEDFTERIIPLFTKVEIQSQRLIALREDCLKSREETERLQQKLTGAELFLTKSIQLETDLKEAKKNENEAIRLAEIAKNDLGKAHESSVQWKKRASELAAENKRYKDMLEKNVESARSAREKQKKLQKQITELTHKLDAKEKETMSDTTQGYDGDFSTHEHSTMRSSLHGMSTPSRIARHTQDHDHVDLDMEGMPPPRFPSDWQLNKPNYGALKRQSLNDAHQRATHRFPIDLDRKGRPTRAVQIGPCSLIRIAP